MMIMVNFFLSVFCHWSLLNFFDFDQRLLEVVRKMCLVVTTAQYLDGLWFWFLLGRLDFIYYFFVSH